MKTPLLSLLAAVGLLLPASAVEAAQQFPLLQRAASCDVVKDRLADVIADLAYQQSLHRYRYKHRRYRFRGGPMPRPARAMARSSAPTADAAGKSANEAAPQSSGSGGASGPSHFTGTNNQVDGVHEADRVKSDGRFLYTIAGREVLIVKSWPATATSIVARYQPGPKQTPHTLFLRGDKLVVLSKHYDYRQSSGPYYYAGRARRSYRRAVAGLRLTVLDISRRGQPKALAHVDLDGTLLAARRIGREMYLMTSSTLQLPADLWTEMYKPVTARVGGPRRINYYQWDQLGRPIRRPAQVISSQQPDWATLRQRARRLLDRQAVQKMLPVATFRSGQGQSLAQRTLQSCSDLYVPQDGAQLGLLSLTRLSLDGGRVHSTGVLTSGQRVYASRKSLYVAGTARAVPSWRRQRFAGWSGTVIHKFALGTAPKYLASGGVPGYLLNQFSMDEHRGYLRVATTQGGWGWRSGGQGGNGLFVLGQSGARLSVVGSVTGLAPGERIYAARMLGDQGYIVTFRQTDPLYTLDLSNPREPRKLGELKINGYSSYIHPLGHGKLLTIGQDASSTGRVRGAHLQIFDVSNLRQPTRTHHLLLTPQGRSTSQAQYDHHAFTYDARSKLLAVPLSSYSSGQRFNGIALVKVDTRGGFSALGEIDHADLNGPVAAIGWRCPPNARCRPPRRPSYAAVPIQRTVFIDRYMYTLSTIGLKVHDVGTLQPRRVAALRLAAR